MKKSRLNYLLSTSNFVLCFIGFQLATSLFLPVSSDVEEISRSVSVPYRAITLLLSFVVIAINFSKPSAKFPKAIYAILFYWFIYIIRMVYDVYIRTDLNLSNDPRITQVWIYVFLICIPQFYSIIKSYKNIDLNKSFWWMLALTFLTLLLTLFTNQAILGQTDSTERQGGNAAFSTITFGHFGTTCIILGIFTLLKKKTNLVVKIIILMMIIFGAFCMLRSGSRGPILALVVVLIFWFFSRSKNVLRGVIAVFIFGIISLLFIDQILNIIGNISPLIEDRLRLSINEGDSSGRDPYYDFAIKAFYESPIIGKQFVLFLPNGSFDYAHNMILDALMGLGLIGGCTLVYFLYLAIKKCYFLIHINDSQYWICLLLIQQIMLNMLSSSFYYNPLLSVLLTFLFLNYRDFKTKKVLYKLQY